MKRRRETEKEKDEEANREGETARAWQPCLFGSKAMVCVRERQRVILTGKESESGMAGERERVRGRQR